MHISSTTNPLSHSEANVPVTVFIFEDRRKFLRVSKDYLETLKHVARAFSIANNVRLSIHTSSLDVCKGVAVEIDESAYPFMWSILDEITVKVEGKRPKEVAAPTPRATSFSRQTTPKPSTSRLDKKKFDDQEQAEEEEVAMGVNAEDDDKELADAEEAAAHERELLLEAEAAVAEAEAEAAAAAEAEAMAVAEAAAADLAWDFTDEQPQKGKHRSETAESTPTSKFKPSRAVSGSTKTRDDRSVTSEQTAVESPRDTTSRSAHPSKSSPKEPVPSTPAVAADADPRFEITILGPESYQVAQFKTRGKHPARKVLAAACRLFELDHQSAHLYVGVPSAKSTRGAVKCEIDATMTQCGVDSHSRLYVRVNNGNEELESEEEDE